MIGSVKPPLELKKRLLSSKQLQQHNFSFGQSGEETALRYLRTKGYQILDTNVRFGNHEIDIVVLDPHFHEIVFIEVKARKSEQFGSATTAVNYRKLKSLRVAATQYLKLKQLAHDYRFDIITVLPNKVDHFENVTW